jgi:prepilin-type processing-associated H-X9-DG protein
MYSLSSEHKQLLFDYSSGLATEEETTQAKALIADYREAAEIHSKLKAVLAPLDTLRPEPCPDELAQRTIWRLRLANAEELIKQPEKAVGKSHFLHHVAEVGSVAAIILFAIGILLPSFSFARHQYWKNFCQRQLAGISNSINLYSSDYDGRLPAVTTDVSQPWHRVGHQGKDNHSNTRNLFLLLRLGYSDRPNDFVCCGRRQEAFTQLKVSQVTNYNDFPTREHITYSFRIVCRPPVKMSLLTGQPLMADRSPVFENVSDDRFEVHLDMSLSTRNSMNHGERGQNVLFSDGHVEFLITRHTGIPQDDIFTLQKIAEYRGKERPACEKDPFLAP